MDMLTNCFTSPNWSPKVPGLLMTVVFAQMKLLAIPLLSMPRFGFGGFGESYDESRAREQLVILRPKDAPQVDWKKLDERIADIASPVEGLFIMKVPTFKVSLLGSVKFWQEFGW